MLWEYRRRALRKIPGWFIRLRLSILRVRMRKNQIYDARGNLRGKIVDMLIRDYLKSLLFVNTEVFVLYERIRKEKERLVKENIKLVYDIMRRMRVKGDDWEEAFSYALEGLYIAVENWDEEHALSTIAYQWIMAKIQDFYEHQSKNFALSYSQPVKEDEEETFEIFMGMEENFEEKADFKELLSRLAEEERRVVHMVYWDGYSLKEAANILGMSSNRARKLLQKALNKLKYLLSPQEGDFWASQKEVYCYASL